MPLDDGSTLCGTNDRPECSSESRPDWPLARTVVPQRPATVALFLAAATLMLNACASPVATTAPTAPTSQGVAPTTPPSSAAASHPGPAESTNPVVVGFAFAAEDIVAYYQSQGYACSTRQPSTKA